MPCDAAANQLPPTIDELSEVIDSERRERPSWLELRHAIPYRLGGFLTGIDHNGSCRPRRGMSADTMNAASNQAY